MSDTVVKLPARKTRSRVSNGRPFIDGDGRSAWSRRFRDLCDTYSDHIGGRPTPPQQSLIRRIAALDCQAEAMESDMAEGKPVDVDVFNRLAGNLRRLLAQLGFDETKRDTGPTDIHAYAAAMRLKNGGGA